MARLAVFGATGNLGREVARGALARGLDLTVVVRSPGRLPPEVSAKAHVVTADLASATVDELGRAVAGADAVVCCAGLVTEGERFVALVDRVASAIEAVPARPVAWFLAGAALLDLDARGRRGVMLPKVRDTYAPHQRNLERLTRSDLDWRLLCPGPMVDEPALGVARLRVAIDVMPAPLPAFAAHLPGPLLLPLFAWKIPELIVPYADAAAVMLDHLAPNDPMSRHRVGVALPPGMRGKKRVWTAAPSPS